MEKRAEIAISTIVTIALIVLGLVILLILWWQLSSSATIDKEVCHNSVIYRATLPNFADAKDYIPLKCKTDKICITTSSSGKCSEFSGAKGITYVKVQDKKQIEQLIARNVLDCWTMMGEGKVSIFSNYWATTFSIGEVYPSCVICTRIAYDEQSLQTKGINIKDIDVSTYMQTHKIPNKDETYSEYFIKNGGAKISLKDNIQYVETVEAGKTPSTKTIEIKENNALQTLKNKELAILFMQISSPDVSSVLKSDIDAIIGIGVTSFWAAPKTTSSVAWAALKSAVKGGLVLKVAIIGGLIQAGSVLNNQAITAGYCGDVSLGGSARSGCSVIRTVGYNEAEISEYCSVIEGTP